jgi:hypothetical protein
MRLREEGEAGWAVKNWNDLYDNYADNRISWLKVGPTDLKWSYWQKEYEHRNLTDKLRNLYDYNVGKRLIK